MYRLPPLCIRIHGVAFIPTPSTMYGTDAYCPHARVTRSLQCSGLCLHDNAFRRLYMAFATSANVFVTLNNVSATII